MKDLKKRAFFRTENRKSFLTGDFSFPLPFLQQSPEKQHLIDRFYCLALYRGKFILSDVS